MIKTIKNLFQKKEQVRLKITSPIYVGESKRLVKDLPLAIERILRDSDSKHILETDAHLLTVDEMAIVRTSIGLLDGMQIDDDLFEPVLTEEFNTKLHILVADLHKTVKEYLDLRSKQEQALMGNVEDTLEHRKDRIKKRSDLIFQLYFLVKDIFNELHKNYDYWSDYFNIEKTKEV